MIRAAIEAFRDFPAFVCFTAKWAAIVGAAVAAMAVLVAATYRVIDWESWAAVEPINRAGVSTAIMVSLSALVMAALAVAGYRK